MSKELELWKFVYDHLAKGEDLVLLVVAESSGSSPGRPGFKMAVGSNEMHGSIGGGVMEVSLVERARQMLKSENPPEPGPVRQVHRSDSEYASGMICSGEQTVIMRRFSSVETEAVYQCVTAIETGSDQAILLTPDRFELNPSHEAPQIRFEHETNGGYLFAERLLTENELFIIGGGHCALALSELMARMNFRIRLYDDRPDLNTLSKNRFAHEINIIDKYSSVGKIIESGANRFVVVMTIGYKYDKVVVRELLDKDFRYFGVLGSKAKMAVLLRELKEEGLDAERLDSIRTPIGMNINSRTPFEIAISIAAEIISVKNQGN